VGHWTCSELQAGLASPYVLLKVYFILDQLVLCLLAALNALSAAGVKKETPAGVIDISLPVRGRDEFQGHHLYQLEIKRAEAGRLRAHYLLSGVDSGD
jgi:hypothetical protein